MAELNIADSVLNPQLTKFAIKYTVPGLEPVLPRLQLKAGAHVVKVPSYGTDWLGLSGVHKRELGAKYEAELGREAPSLTEVVLERWSASEIVDLDDPTLIGASVGAYAETLQDKVAILKEKLLRKQAVLEAQAITTTSNYTTTTTPGTKWDNNGNFIDDILTAIETINDAVGVAPDTLVIPRRVVYALTQNTYWVDRVKYTQTAFSQEGVINALKALFGFQRVVIPPFVTYRAEDGTLTDVYSDNVAVLYLGQGLNLKNQAAPVWGVVFEEAGFPRIRTAKIAEGTQILADHWFKLKVFVKSAGYLITDVLT